MVVPEEAVELFKAKGFGNLQVSELLNPEELTPEELDELDEMREKYGV